MKTKTRPDTGEQLRQAIVERVAASPRRALPLGELYRGLPGRVSLGPVSRRPTRPSSNRGNSPVALDGCHVPTERPGVLPDLGAGDHGIRDCNYSRLRQDMLS